MRRQVGIRKTNADDRCGRVVIESGGIRTGVTFWPGMSLAGVPLIGQVVSGVEAT